MTPERWSRLRELFGAVLETPQPERSRFLDSACGADTDLREQLEQLLAAQHEPSWESPARMLFPLAAEFEQGDRLAQYRIDSRLGEGGMGVVYKAWDTRLDREVALKVLSREGVVDAQRRERLIAEARAASALNHPNIVTIYGLGHERGVEFIAMECVDGLSLAQVIPRNGLAFTLVLDYAIEIAAALAKAHAMGVIHRDLKPANIMVTSEGRIKLLDFGLAWRAPLVDSATANLVAESGIAGTTGYMSPEQVRGATIDHRSDLFSFGVVLFEMATGQSPFTGKSAAVVCDAILHAAPRDFGDISVPMRFKDIVRKLLEKDPSNRYETADAVYTDLKRLHTPEALASPGRLSGRTRTALIGAAVLAVALATSLWRKSTRERWALETATPEIERLLDAGQYVKAAALAQDAAAVLPKNPTLRTLWLRATDELLVTTAPAGADVSCRPYRGDQNGWRSLGKTPLTNVRIPLDGYACRLVKPGFATAFFISEPLGPAPPGYHYTLHWKFNLRPEASVPMEMVPVTGGKTGLSYPLGTAPFVSVGDFLIDRHEVTNEEYSKFVDAGGYARPEFWKEPFVKEGRRIGWNEAMAFFHDSTGRPGPATWESGSWPRGKNKHPVAGVSWYEANAYAEFVGKKLPTAYHWTLASQSSAHTPLITAGSNFAGADTREVGRAGALSGFGTTDMAGNVKEWCANEATGRRRLIMGGGFGEPSYMFNHADAQSPWDRRANFGFRCVRYDAPPSEASTQLIDAHARDYWKEKPVSDEVFKAYSTMYAYDKRELNAEVRATESKADWIQQKIVFDAAYGHERVPAYVFLPKNARPPFQVVVYFPGAFAFIDNSLDPTTVEMRAFLIKSGRALVFPIYKGMYERRDGFLPVNNPPGFERDHAIAWAQDLGRTLDYVETRKDLDGGKVAWFGDSLGGPEGVHMVAVEKRIKVAILSSGGLQLTLPYLPEADPFNFEPRVTIPVLMLNGRYDASFPLESSQQPMFYFLGTPARDKKHVIYEGGHGVFPRPAGVRECLDWLDRYLGPVRQ